MMSNKCGWERFCRLPQARGLRVVQGNNGGAASIATPSHKGITNKYMHLQSRPMVESDTRNLEQSTVSSKVH